MKPAESFLSQPIRDLQTMLRVIGKHLSQENLLIPDGIYGPDTMGAVADFQRAHGLPPTGAADQTTWEEIHRAYVPARIHQVPAQPLHILLDANQVLGKGESSANLFLVQAMLTVLSRQFLSVAAPPFTGILDEGTGKSLASFQYLCGLPPTGTLDKVTWRHLALQYPLAADLHPKKPAGTASV